MTQESIPETQSLSGSEPSRASAARPLRDAGEEIAEVQASWVTRIGAWLTPLSFLALWFAPLPLPEPAHRLAAIAAAVLIAWVTEIVPLPVTALAIAPCLVMTGIAPAKTAFAAYADPILFLFVGSFFIGRAMTRHGLDQRMAERIATMPGVAGRPPRLRLAVMASAMAISMWMSNTGTTAILLPVLLGMLGGRGTGQAGTFSAGSVLGLAHASTTGGLATLVGTPPNAIVARILQSEGIRIGFLDWMTIGVPAALALTGCAYAVIAWLLPAVFPSAAIAARDQSAPSAAEEMAADAPILRERGAELGSRSEVPASWSRGERVTALSFGLAIVGWVLPDMAKLAGVSWADPLARVLEPGAVAIAASSLLFLVPRARGKERVLPWSDAVQIEWGLILLFGGGIALGEAMFQTGLAKTLGEGFLALTGVETLWGLTFVSLLLAIALTEFCSNTAAANMLAPLAIGAAAQLGVSPIPPALAVGLGASCGFMLPVATGPSAIAYGTGLVRARDMIRVGVWLDLLSAIIVFAVLRLLCPLLGWA